MDSEAFAAVVGARVREARVERGLSLGTLAAEAAIGKGSLSEIENGVRNPTLATLYALAGALGLPLAALLAQQRGAMVESPGIAALLLDVTADALGTVETYRLDLRAGQPHASGAHGAGVTEVLLVTRGRIRAGRDGEEGEAGPGDVLEWVSDAPHGYLALGGDASAVLVVTTPAR
ncbi:helix-turn-helix domain-containing protein [Demequina lignilytica]|uniref:XRE family transcriptional regulator n=1 Tax=Demequina lignilytica TaxID=3051663 RepID=A0AAW7M7L2_9MICO|nr:MULTISPECIES: XRE family transcriptional regulator [unclassified Demequina]MDN4477789.1 XRE family transcriptional regulator [Demequina sp. SYSU T00039-1]MDN4483429.1 XRE family transcriptional regulator [Demequina sp. SYSU T0a273]MDN4487698.1 XRE family transcriptional regulator [Demequina sp. SYSU T00039]MDN4491409.1 XRE family transcriptional regulator [Demequina sp. SYSU T00068]